MLEGLVDTGGLFQSVFGYAVGLGVIIALATVLVIFFLLKAYHYPPVQRFPYHIRYKEPRGGRMITVFKDRFVKIADKEGEYLLTKRERLKIPTAYLEYLDGDELVVHGRNRYEIFPFAPLASDYFKKMLNKPVSGTPANEAKERLVALENYETVTYREVTSPEAVDAFYAGLQKDQNKFSKPGMLQQMAPYAGLIIMGIFILILLMATIGEIGKVADKFVTAGDRFAGAVNNLGDRMEEQTAERSAPTTPQPENQPPY